MMAVRIVRRVNLDAARASGAMFMAAIPDHSPGHFGDIS
jgi:hypothetical protein